jgi:Family of unknown function (DUF6221)
VTDLPDLASDPLLAFIVARLGDEEHYADIAQSQRPAPWQHQEHAGVASAARDLFDGTGNLIAVIHGSYIADYLVRRDAARALREAEADRAILSAYERSARAATAGTSFSHDLRRLLIARAAVWQDHPDYAAAVVKHLSDPRSDSRSGRLPHGERHAGRTVGAARAKAASPCWMQSWVICALAGGTLGHQMRAGVPRGMLSRRRSGRAGYRQG